MTKTAYPNGLSVVVATMNRDTVLLDTLADLQAQDFPDYEVIVVDQSDAPNPAAHRLLADFPKPARYVHVTQFRGLPQARNHGWRLATKDILVFVDDDIRCKADFLTAHYKAHVQSGATIVAGGITEAAGDRRRAGRTGGFNWWTASPIANFHLKTPTWCVSGKGANFSIKRDALADSGGFDEALTVGAALYEETELGLRLFDPGKSCWFAPEAHVTHLAAPMGGCRVGRDIAGYMFGLGHNRAIVIFRHLRWWHRPTAVLRVLLLGLSYSRTHRSFRPLLALMSGLRAGRMNAKAPTFRSVEVTS